MYHYQRAIAHSDTDIDRHVRERTGGSLRNAAHARGWLALADRLAAGEWPAREIEQFRAAHYPGVTGELWSRTQAYVQAGRTPRERAERLTDCVLARKMDWTIGAPMERQPRAVHEEVDRARESLARTEVAHELEQRAAARDAHRDRQNGIDEQARAEQARRAAMTNPDTERRADVERSFARHEGEGPVLYPHVRRELVARQADRNVERLRSREVRDADPYRLPDRSDDRRDDLALAYDCEMVNTLAADELALRDNPVLEATDYALTYAETTRDE